MQEDLFMQIGGEILSFASLGVRAASIRRKISAADELRFTVAADARPQNLCAGTSLKVLRGGSVIFIGAIEKAHAANAANKKSFEYSAKNAWADLERIVYQQLWKVPSNPADPQSGLEDALKSRVILGQNAQGQKINLKEQLEDILSYARACGADFETYFAEPENPMLFDEVRDLSCAEAILKTLAWAPDAAVYFDYSSGQTRISVLKRASAQRVFIDVKDGDTLEYSAAARPDLQVAGVCVKYEKTHSADDVEWQTLEEDIYPVAFDQRAKNALVMTVELGGRSADRQLNTIVTTPILPNTTGWWLERFPVYKDQKYKNFSIESTSRLGSYGRELKSGSIYDWMGAGLEEDEIKATVYYEIGAMRVHRPLSVRLKATNASSGTFARFVLNEIAEEAPAGLAQAVYEAAAPLQFEGSVELSKRDADASSIMRARLNLLNAESEFASMDARVCACNEDLATGRVKFLFGPPKHLYPGDIADLFRINRPRKVPRYGAAKVTAKSRSAAFETGGEGAMSDSGAGEGVFSSFMISTEDETPDAPRKIVLDAGVLKADEEMRPREIALCKDGELMFASVLMTEPQAQEEE